MTTADRLNAFQITRADLNAVLDMVARLGAMPSSDFEETVMELYRRDPGRGQAVYHRLWALVHAASSDRALAWLRPDQASRRMREIMLDVATTMRLVDTGDGFRFPRMISWQRSPRGRPAGGGSPSASPRS